MSSAPAAPGSYGVAPSGYRLPDATRLGAVGLQVADLARSLSWYQDVLGLRVLHSDARSAILTAQDDQRALLELRERRHAAPVAHRGRLGLYHYAVLLPDRASLARFVRHLAAVGVQAGSADHLVSEAFYLRDPDGLGIEVYADRPRGAWRREGREIVMATDPVDLDDLLRAAGDSEWSGMPAGATIGHLHLHVGSLADARRFFSEGLGFDVTTASYPGALFLGAGGYHHHVGANTWAGSAATPPGEADARLLDWSIVLPTVSDVRAAGESLERDGYPVEHRNDGAILTRDPWGTAVRLTSAVTS